MAGRGQGLRVRRAPRQGEPARPLRWPPSVDRLPCLLRARGTTYAEGGSYPERACVGCSFVADQVAHLAHLNARNTTLVFASRAPGRDPGPEGAPRMGAHPGTRSPTTSIPTSTSRSGTAPTPSSARTTRSSAPTSSAPAATSRWGTPGTTSTSPRSAAMRNGRTRGGSPANPAVRVVELPRRLHRGQVITPSREGRWRASALTGAGGLVLQQRHPSSSSSSYDAMNKDHHRTSTPFGTSSTSRREREHLQQLQHLRSKPTCGNGV